MVETDYTAAAGAAPLAALVASTSKQLTTQLPGGAVAPLFSTAPSGAIVSRDGREVRPPVKRAGSPPVGGS